MSGTAGGVQSGQRHRRDRYGADERLRRRGAVAGALDVAHAGGPHAQHRADVPGVAHNESTDSDAFDCENAPAFFLTSSDWSYGDYTWHTNRDTYDKINFDNVKRNATLVAMFAYQASEDPSKVSRTRRVPPGDEKTGRPTSVPKCDQPPRSWAATLRP